MRQQLDERSDAYGAMLLAGLSGSPVAEIVEREDGPARDHHGRQPGPSPRHP
jgi:hypothetical protein